MSFRNAKASDFCRASNGLIFSGALTRENRLPLMPTRLVDVLVPVALDCAYSFRAPSELELAPGDIVRCAARPARTYGVVWAENATPIRDLITGSKASAKS